MDTTTQEILGALGVQPENITVLPDGSAFAVGSMPLPEDHWIYERDDEDLIGPPPMPWRMGEGPERSMRAEQIREAARYAIRASTWCGKEMDFDPDAMVRNFVLGLLGYWSVDGTGTEAWHNPDPLPPLWEEK